MNTKLFLLSVFVWFSSFGLTHAQDKPVFSMAEGVVINLDELKPYKSEFDLAFKSALANSETLTYRPWNVEDFMAEFVTVRDVAMDSGMDLDEFARLAEINAKVIMAIRSIPEDKLQDFALEQVDYLLFPTISGYSNPGIFNLFGQGAVVAELMYFELSTRKVFSAVTGVWSPFAFNEMSKQVASKDSVDYGALANGLARDAAFVLEQTYQIKDPAALETLNDIRFLDVDVIARKPARKMEIASKVMGIGLLTVTATNALGVFGTGPASPYGKATFLSAIGVYGGIYWFYAGFARYVEKPFRSSEKRKLARQYRRQTGQALPELYAGPETEEKKKK